MMQPNNKLYYTSSSMLFTEDVERIKQLGAWINVEFRPVESVSGGGEV